MFNSKNSTIGGFRIPRSKSDKIITHRIEFSPKEREIIDTIINTQKENQRLDAVTNTFQAVGVGLSGGGLLVAGLAVAAWFGYSFKDEVIDKTKNFVDTTTEVLAPLVLGKSIDQMTEEVTQVIGEDYNLLKEEGRQLVQERNRYCNTNSQYYNAQECARVDAELQDLNRRISEARAAMFGAIKDEAQKEANSSFFWGIATLPNRF
jgi:hypothetical protein